MAVSFDSHFSFWTFAAMRSHSHINSAKKILQEYDGNMPLAAWLKNFFRTDKKYGSSDRRQITHLCFCFFRLGNAFKNFTVEEKLLTGIFLCSDQPNRILEEVKPEWNARSRENIADKLQFLDAVDESRHIFPFNELLTKEINNRTFNLSFLTQPDLFLRIRPGKRERILDQLTMAGIPFSNKNDTVRLPGQVSISEVLFTDKDVVVQDMNSQRVLDPLNDFFAKDSKLDMWDCCAASGGKSILFHDLFPEADITVSDIRETILLNLRNRFTRAGIKNYKAFTGDISDFNFRHKKQFDVVICDAPCSGSGTWARTPEQMHFFTEEKLHHYTSLQKSIVRNAIKGVRKNGYFIYITCSVFAFENEMIVHFISDTFPAGIQSVKYLNGYESRADTLFAAVFKVL